MENFVKSMGKVKNNKEFINVCYSPTSQASAASERKFFGILTIKLNGKMVKSMVNMKIEKENMNF